MVTLSRFSHCFNLGDSVALYHSLRMKPVYLSREEYRALQTYIANSNAAQNDVPLPLKQVVEELTKWKVLKKETDEDDKVLKFIRSGVPEPAINVCYFILSEQCNLACKYCFLGNNDHEKRRRFAVGNMCKETAEKALLFFIRQIELSGANSPENKPAIIFYGGEPLINFEVLEYVAQRIQQLRPQVDSIRNIELSVITNGVLLDEHRINRLKALDVGIGISIDGCTEETNAMRVDRAGQLSFKHVVKTLDKTKELGVDVSLSITLTDETIKDKQKVLDLITKYEVKGLGFNILLSDEVFKPRDGYDEAAAQFIIDMFVDLRKLGVYEDRIMRKLKAFSKARVYFSDCAATSGAQIVITPDGCVGICHGCLADRHYFVSSVEDATFDARTNPVFKEWARLTPVCREECLSCAALGICGGGCPINAKHSAPESTIHSLDKRFCTHAKKTLEFLIHDLHRIMQTHKG